MLRFAFFGATCGAIMMGMGLLPKPASESLPDFTLSNISIPDQPTLLVNISEARLNLPELGRQIEERVSRVFSNPDVDEPQLPEVVERTAVTIPASASGIVHFELNKAELDAGAKAQLDDFAAKLANNQTSKIEIFGHTDLTGPEAYNDGLGLRRAAQVAAYLAVTGIDPDRITLVTSKGETSPVVKTEEASRENRRVTIATVHNI
ncbi:OmpA family protein [Rhodobacteraceae bacterium]|nr:OmpA family protein [Paracoccaceae bacterium]